MGCYLLIACALFTSLGFAQGFTDDLPTLPGLGTDWSDLVEEQQLTLEPNECKVFKFDSKKAEYRITLDVSDFNGCDPTDIELSKVYYEGQCLEREKITSLTLDCKEPGEHGVEDKEHMCENFGDLVDTETFDPDEADGKIKNIEGSVCFEESNYFIAMKSSCDKASSIKISVDKRSLTALDDTQCLKLQSFRQGERSFGYRITHDYLWALILVIIFIVLILPAAITMCICFCACCQCCACCVTIAKTPIKCACCACKPIKKLLCCCK